MNTTKFNRPQDLAFSYQAPSSMVIDISPEGVLCESERQIDDFELLPETDW